MVTSGANCIKEFGIKNGPLERRYLLDTQLERCGACAAFLSVVPLYFFSVGGFRGSVYRFLLWGWHDQKEDMREKTLKK